MLKKISCIEKRENKGESLVKKFVSQRKVVGKN